MTNATPHAALPTTIRQIAASWNKPGEIVLVGVHGGAYAQHYRSVKVDGDEVIMEAVRSVRVSYADGTFGNTWERVIA